MTLEDLLSRMGPALERAEIPYMITGSVASSAHGAPRSTRDLDIVIAPTSEQLQALLKQLPSSSYYADQQQALEALANRSQFNVVDFAAGWKVDFIIAEESEYGRTALARRRLSRISENPVYLTAAEDVVIAKLRWSKMGGSDRQLHDAAGIVTTQGSRLDIAYIEHWIGALSLESQWHAVREMSA